MQRNTAFARFGRKSSFRSLMALMALMALVALAAACPAPGRQVSDYTVRLDVEPGRAELGRQDSRPDRVAPRPDHPQPDVASKTHVAVSLKTLRAHALATLAQATNNLALVPSSMRIWLQDGVGGLDVPPVSDYARLAFVADPVDTSVLPQPRLKIAYWAALQGFEVAAFVELTPSSSAGGVQILYYASGGNAVLKDGTKPADVAALTAKLTASFPTVKLTYLQTIGILSFNAEPAVFLQVFFAIRESPLVAATEIDGEIYPIDSQWGVALDLGDGTEDSCIDLYQSKYLPVTKPLRDAGTPFFTQPQLPPPLAGSCAP